MGWNLAKDKDIITEGMRIHWRRFVFNLLHPFQINTYRNKLDRKGYEDLVHSFTNLFVEYARLSAYQAGHWFQLSVLLNGVLMITLVTVTLILL